MYVVLLTGGLASGKDTVSALLATFGATILDTDILAKRAQEDEVVLEQLKEEFGDDIVDANGLPNRQLLAERAFISQERAEKLNAISWPPVKDRIVEYLTNPRRQPTEQEGLLVIQIPLLTEAPDFLDLADEVITVIADEETRFKRALTRGMKALDARQRLALQASDEKRISISDTVFDNNGTLKQLEDQVHAWYRNRIESRML